MRTLFGEDGSVVHLASCRLFLACFSMVVCCGSSERAGAAILATKTFCRFAGAQGYLLAEDAANVGWDIYPQHGKVWLGWANGSSRWAYKPTSLASSDAFRSGFSTSLSNSYPYSFTFYPQPDNVRLVLNILSDRPPTASWTAAASPDPGLQIVKAPAFGTLTDQGSTLQYTVDLTTIPVSSPGTLYTDNFTYYVTDSTIEDLPSALGPDCVLGTVCYYGIGNLNHSRLVAGTAIISDNRVVPAAERASARAGGGGRLGAGQADATCATVDANRTIDIPCVAGAGQFYQVVLHAYPVQSDPAGEYWALAAVVQTTDNGSCASVDSETMTVSLPCVSINTIDYSMSLNHYDHMADPDGIYWSLGAVQPLTDTSLSGQGW